MGLESLTFVEDERERAIFGPLLKEKAMSEGLLEPVEKADKVEDVFGLPDPATKAPKVEKRMLTVTRMYKEGKIVTREEADDETIEVAVPHSGVPMAEIGFGCRMTINLGNFETVQLGVEIRLPTPVEELDDCFMAAKNFVDVKLNTEVAALREFKATRGK